MINPSSAYDIDINLSKDYNYKFLYREAYIFSLLINNSFDNDIYSKIIKKEEINKGFSSDKKYTILDNDNNKYLLRISSFDKFKGKLNQFINLNKLVELNVNMIEPIKFGICDVGVYAIHSWIEGVNATNYIPKLSKKDQYKYGIIAGLELKKIHKLKCSY